MVEKATERKSNVEERRWENLYDVLAFVAVARERSFTGLWRSSASGEHSAEMILWPAPAKFLPAQSRHQGRAIIDYSLIDIVAVHYDAAFGEQKNVEGLFMARLSALRA